MKNPENQLPQENQEIAAKEALMQQECNLVWDVMDLYIADRDVSDDVYDSYREKLTPSYRRMAKLLFELYQAHALTIKDVAWKLQHPLYDELFTDEFKQLGESINSAALYVEFGKWVDKEANHKLLDLISGL